MQQGWKDLCSKVMKPNGVILCLRLLLSGRACRWWFAVCVEFGGWLQSSVGVAWPSPQLVPRLPGVCSHPCRRARITGACPGLCHVLWTYRMVSKGFLTINSPLVATSCLGRLPVCPPNTSSWPFWSTVNQPCYNLSFNPLLSLTDLKSQTWLFKWIIPLNSSQSLAITSRKKESCSHFISSECCWFVSLCVQGLLSRSAIEVTLWIGQFLYGTTAAVLCQEVIITRIAARPCRRTL